MLFYVLSLIFTLTSFCGCAVAHSEGEIDPKVIPIKTCVPQGDKIYPIAIIGAGAAGSMAAKRAVLNNDQVLVFTGAKQERRRSRGNWVRSVDNIPGFERYTRAVLELRNETFLQLHNHTLGSNLYLIEDSVVSIVQKNELFELKDSAGSSYWAKFVILATGIMDEQPHIQGSIRPILTYANKQDIAYCMLCDGHRAIGKKTVVIGHSEDAAEGAILLAEKYSPPSLTLLTNGKPPEYSASSLAQMQLKHISICMSPIQEILGQKSPTQLLGFKLENGESIAAEMGFVALGIRPNNQLALQLGAKVDERGLVLTDCYGETSITNLFVAGDLRANSLKQIYSAWQHAVESSLVISERIRSLKAGNALDGSGIQ